MIAKSALKIANVILLFLLSLISLNYLYPFWKVLDISTSSLGLLGWIFFAITLLNLCRGFIVKALCIFGLFFSVAYFSGYYLEPPSDAGGHVQRTYLFCGKDAGQIRDRVSGPGLWQYSMTGDVLCTTYPHRDPRRVLKKINFVYGLYWGIVFAGLFILAKSASMPDRWAFFSLLLALLFFGTNRFGYFSYFSLAASFTSILIYWLWIAVFFLKRGWKNILTGVLVAGLCIPILRVNHTQEAVFLGFIVLVWLFVNLHERIWGYLKNERRISIPEKNRKIIKTVYVLLIFLALFILPQFDFVRNILSRFFIQNHWAKNREAVYFWHGLLVTGKFWSYRINDTLGFMGLLPVLITPLFFWKGLVPGKIGFKARLCVLGWIPFLVYAIPLFNYIWVSNYLIEIYWRFSYASIFWIPIAYLLFGLEGHFALALEKIRLSKKMKIFEKVTPQLYNMMFFAVCVLVLFSVSSVRSSPIYGKIDFMLVDKKPWWPQWEPMITGLMNKERKTIYSDPQTSAILHGIFNLPTVTCTSNRRDRDYNRHPRRILDISRMQKVSKKKNYRCLINLRGFQSSWVPAETGHWLPGLGETSLYYRLNGLTGDDLVEYLKENPPKDCEVYY